MTIRASIVIAAACVAISLSNHSKAGSTLTGTAFSYQGVLKQNNAPANGTHHLRFQLWDALSGGNQIGADVVHPAPILTVQPINPDTSTSEATVLSQPVGSGSARPAKRICLVEAMKALRAVKDAEIASLQAKMNAEINELRAAY